MRSLRDIKDVDLKRSKIDEQKSDPKTGKYVFIEKKYVDDAIRATDNVYFNWCEYNPRDGYQMLNSWMVKYNYEAVKQGEHPYWPEGIRPNAAGLYQFGDVVRVVRPLTEELSDLEFQQNLSKRGAKARLDGFKREVNAEEPGAGDIPDNISRGQR